MSKQPRASRLLLRRALCLLPARAAASAHLGLGVALAPGAPAVAAAAGGAGVPPALPADRRHGRSARSHTGLRWLAMLAEGNTHTHAQVTTASGHG